MPRRRMMAILDAQHRRGRAPGVADVRAGAEKCVVVPVPVRRVRRRRECKPGKMKSHPGAATLHVCLKCGALRGVFRTRVQKHHDLIRRKKIRVQVLPVRCGVEREVIARRHLWKPAPSLVHKTDVRRVLLGGVERDSFEARRWSASAERRATQCEEDNQSANSMKWTAISLAVISLGCAGKSWFASPVPRS